MFIEFFLYQRNIPNQSTMLRISSAELRPKDWKGHASKKSPKSDDEDSSGSSIEEGGDNEEDIESEDGDEEDKDSEELRERAPVDIDAEFHDIFNETIQSADRYLEQRRNPPPSPPPPPPPPPALPPTLGVKSKGPDQEPAEAPKSKRARILHRKHFSEKASEKRDFDQFSVEYQAGSEQPIIHRKPVPCAVDYVSRAMPADLQRHSMAMACPTESLGRIHLLRIHNTHDDHALADLMLADEHDEFRLDPGFLWSSKILAKEPPYDISDSVGPGHVHPSRCVAPQTEATPCGVGRASGVCWRIPILNYSNVSIEFPNPIYNENPFAVNEEFPFVSLSGSNISVADINKSKTKISRLLLKWDISLIERIGSQVTPLFVYRIRLPIVLDCEAPNFAPIIVSPFRGVFDNEKLHLELAMERQSTSFDTIVIKNIRLRVLLNAMHGRMTTHGPLCDDLGPISFMKRVPERLYTPQLCNFTHLSKNTTASVGLSQHQSEAQLLSTVKGIRSRSFVIYQVKGIATREGVERFRLGKSDMYAIPFVPQEASKYGQTVFKGDISIVDVFKKVNPSYYRQRGWKQELVEHGNGLQPDLDVLPTALRELFVCIGDSDRKNASDYQAKTFFLPFSGVVCVITAFYYGTLQSMHTPFFWRCITNLEYMLAKTCINESHHSRNQQVDTLMEFLRAEHAEKDKTKKKYISETHHYDMDSTFLFASSCSLAYGRLDTTLANRRNHRDLAAMPMINPKSSLPTLSSLAMNVPDFFAISDYKSRVESLNLVSSKQKNPSARLNTIANQQKSLIKEFGFVRDRLIWNVVCEQRVVRLHEGVAAAAAAAVGGVEKHTRLFTLNSEYCISNVDQLLNGSTRSKLIDRLDQDSHQRSFNSLVWFYGDLLHPREGHPIAAESFENLIHLSDVFTKDFGCWHAKVDARIPVEYRRDPTQKPLIQLMEDLPNVGHVNITAAVLDGDKFSQETYKFNTLLLAQKSCMIYAQASSTMNKNKDMIKITGEGDFLFKPSMEFMQASVHEDKEFMIKIYRSVVRDDIEETQEYITDAAADPHCPPMMGHTLSTFLWDCLCIGDFLQSKPLCRSILRYIVAESGLCCSDIDVFTGFDSNNTIRHTPCKDSYSKDIFLKGFTVCREPVLNGFTIFMALRALAKPDIAKEHGLDFLYRGIAAVMGPRLDLSGWILGESFSKASGLFEGLSADTVKDFEAKLATAARQRKLAFQRCFRRDTGPVDHNDTTCNKHKNDKNGRNKKKQEILPARDQGENNDEDDDDEDQLDFSALE